MTLRFDDFTLDPDTGELRRGGERVKLKPQPAQVLVLLSRRAGTLVTREEIQKELWPDDTYVDFDLGINSCIRQVRQALGDDPDAPRFVQTIPRKGYRFLVSQRAEETPSSTLAPPRGSTLRWVIAALVAIVAAWALWPLPPSTSEPVVRVTIPLVAPWQQSSRPVIAMSPDGTRLVYVSEETGFRNLYMRRLDRREATLIPGTEGAHYPFFSPDGEWLGFWADRALRKMPVEGGEPLEMCPARGVLGAAWGPDDRILLSDNYGPLWECSSLGGERRQVTILDKRERGHLWPQFLPGGTHVLFTLTGAGFRSDVAVASLETGETQVVVERGYGARYASSGHLIFARRDGRLFAVPFDPGRLEVTGPERAVLSGVESRPPTGAAQFTLSDNGTLAYVPDAARDNNILLWVDRTGNATPIVEEFRFYSVPRLSPDGRRLAVAILRGSQFDLHVLDLERATFTQVTRREASAGIWSPDGTRLTFASNREGSLDVYVKASDGEGEARRLTTSDAEEFPTSWSPDGRHLVFKKGWPHNEVWGLSPDGEAEPRRLLESADQATISPDGRFVAYFSAGEIFVRPFPGPGERVQVSQGGGVHPVWAKDTMELFYRSGERGRRMMAVTVETEPALRASRPEFLFEGNYEWSSYNLHIASFDVTADGQRFVMIRKEDAPAQIHVSFNWFEELKKASAR